MSRKIIGVTVGTTLPKPNFKQTDPTKGDYIKNKPDFDGLKTNVDTISGLVGDTSVSDQIEAAVSQKSQVQMVVSDVSEVLPTLTIHKLTQEEYDHKIADGTIDANALYLTPDEEIDLSQYATATELNTKADANHIHEDVNNAIANLNVLVGDTAVSTQISTAVGEAINDIAALIVTVDGETASHTSEQIYDYVQNGGNVVLYAYWGYIPLVAATDQLAEFSYVSDDYFAYCYAIDSRGQIFEQNDQLALSRTVQTMIDEAIDDLHSTDSTLSIEGMPADSKAVGEAINAVSVLIGDTSVSDQISTAVASKSDTGHTHTASEIGADESGSAARALESAKSYADTKISELINGAPTTLDTLGEIATAMSENADVVSALDAAIGSKANASDLTAHAGSMSNPHKVNLVQLGVTATATELNYVGGTTSNIQTQLNSLSDLIGGVPVPAAIKAAIDIESEDRKALDAELMSQIGFASSEDVEATGLHAKIEAIGALVGGVPVSEQVANAIAQSSQIQFITWEDDD